MHSQINVPDFNLAATLECGQAFRWQRAPAGWFTGIVGREIWHLRQMGETLEWHCSRETFSRPSSSGISEGSKTSGGDRRPCLSRSSSTGRDACATNILPIADREEASRLQHYLGLSEDLQKIAATFPADDSLKQALQRHWGLRVLRQEPWETLASFIASSTKQIIQIRQIVANLSRCFGEQIGEDQFTFPTVEAIARTSHDQLWNCKLGFRAKHLLAAARLIDRGEVPLDLLPKMEYGRALEELCKLNGVGEKIANCTLLFSCGFDQAFPVDVWMARSIKRLYFPRKKVNPRQLREFARTRFGPYGGWAQQYLFFDERTQAQSPKAATSQPRP